MTHAVYFLYFEALLTQITWTREKGGSIIMATSNLASRNEEDLFHSVVMAEESSWKEGYTEGITEKQKKDVHDGYMLGATEGATLGKETGFYAGYASQVINRYKEDPAKERIIKVCGAILKCAVTITKLDPKDETLTDMIANIRGKFKQLTSLLGIKVEFSTVIDGDKHGSTF